MKRVLQHYFLFAILLFGQLSTAQTGLDIAKEELAKLASQKNYSATDLDGILITDDYISRGIRHIYFQQTIDNIGIYGTSGSVHLKSNKIISSNLNFLPQLEKRNIHNVFQVPAKQAVLQLAIDQNYPTDQLQKAIVETDESSPQRASIIRKSGISNRDIPLELVYFVNNAQEVQLAWSVFIEEVRDAAYKNFVVGATNGTVLQVQDLTVNCTFETPHEHDHPHDINKIKTNTADATATAPQLTDSTYNVFKYTIESPNFGSRSIETSPWNNNLLASPNGWHHALGINYEYTQGNNVDAYSDRDNTNSPTGGNAARAFGGSNLVFDFPLDLDSLATDYREAAITNLFYVTNIAHDIFYAYGFDEASGNFQVDNYGNGGSGGDEVFAEAQDSLSTCNAQMITPSDGSSPRIQMFFCGNRDSDYDNGIILHEYSHGVTNRLTGGPQAVACLENDEQMGEGWSDFFGLIASMKASDTSATNRTIGTFLIGQGENGTGIRNYPYTTDMTINPLTYDSIMMLPQVTQFRHLVGTVWATMLWDLNWALIDEYGWDLDIYNGTGGNNTALQLVMEGLKLQPCSPGFVDGRDAILAADSALYNGSNHCIIWEVFARRGLGYSAKQGVTYSRLDGTQAFDMPPSCSIELLHTVNRATANTGERLTFTLTAKNNLDTIATNIIITDTIPDNTHFYAASAGGVLNGNYVEWPAFDLPVGGTKVLELKVTIKDTIAFEEDFIDSLENGIDNWEQVQFSNHAWYLQDTLAYSPSHAWKIINADFPSETHLVLKNPLALTDSSELTFNHYFDLENPFDYGLVEISIDGGDTWSDLDTNFTQNGYNVTTNQNFPAFSHESSLINPNVNGFISTIADLSPYAGEVATIRFVLKTDINTGEEGWIVDDIGISNTKYALPNFSNIRNNDFSFDTESDLMTIIERNIINHTVETETDTLIIYRNSGIELVDVQANDIDPDGPLDTLLTSIIKAASNGTAIVVNNDSISYMPDVDFVGLDTVIYQVCDEANTCEIDTLFVFVNDFNLAPVTMPDFPIIMEDTSNQEIVVQQNDFDPNQWDVLTTSILSPSVFGIATINNGMEIIYTPNADYVGPDTIIYQVCDIANLCTSDTVFVIVSPINDAPIAQTDFASVDFNSSNNFINVQLNDSDVDGPGDTLVTSIEIAPLHGTAIVVDEDSISYTPTVGYAGLDTLIYKVCDTTNICAIDTVFITVNQDFICAGDDLIKDEMGIATSDYIAANTITSMGTVEDTAVVRFIAGDSITLFPGFHAKSASEFIAMIAPCTDGGNPFTGAPTQNEISTINPKINYNNILVRPNPFHDSAYIDYELATTGPVWIGLHDLTGKVLLVFVNQSQQSAGNYTYHLSATPLASGAYWITIRTEKSVLTKKIIVLE